jgi:hypothetical protein
VPELASGVLERVLPQWRSDHATLTILMPSRRGALPSVRTFAEFLIRELPEAVAQRIEPRHVVREAGLIISSDLRPVTPGSSTRLSTSLQIITCNRLGQSVISLLELDYPSRALADGEG